MDFCQGSPPDEQLHDSIFTGAGNDTVDVAIAGSAAGDNRIDLGSGNDIVYVADADKAFGGAGDDIFEASDAKEYRLTGGAGNDTFYLGSNGRALGGDGNDKLFVGAGGDNLLAVPGASVAWFHPDYEMDINLLLGEAQITEVIPFLATLRETQ